MRARTRAARNSKPINVALSEIDTVITNACTKSLDDEQARLLNVLKMGGGYAKVELAAFDSSICTACDYCGAEACDIGHLIWFCPFLPEGSRGAGSGVSKIAADKFEQCGKERSCAWHAM